jgi:hypothetical protein
MMMVALGMAIAEFARATDEERWRASFGSGPRPARLRPTSASSGCALGPNPYQRAIRPSLRLRRMYVLVQTGPDIPL